jgi:WD40 repeat protein
VTVKDAVPSESTVMSMEFLRDGGADMIVAMGVSDGSAKFMEAESGAVYRSVQLQREHGAVTCSQRFSGDVIFFGTSTGELSAVDVRSGAQNGIVWRSPLPVADGAVTCMTAVATKDSITAGFPALACGTAAGTLLLFDVRMRVHLQHISTAGDASYLEGGKAVATGGTLPRAILSMAVDPSFCNKLNSSALNPAVIVSTAAKRISRFDLATGARTLDLQPESTSEVRAMLQIPRSMCLFTSGSDRRVRVWDFSQPSNSYTLYCPPQISPKYALERSAGECAVFREAKLERSLHTQHEESITCMTTATVRQKLHLVTAARDGSLTIWHNFTAPPASTN